MPHVLNLDCHPRVTALAQCSRDKQLPHNFEPYASTQTAYSTCSICVSVLVHIAVCAGIFWGLYTHASLQPSPQLVQITLVGAIDAPLSPYPKQAGVSPTGQVTSVAQPQPTPATAAQSLPTPAAEAFEKQHPPKKTAYPPVTTNTLPRKNTTTPHPQATQQRQQMSLAKTTSRATQLPVQHTMPTQAISPAALSTHAGTAHAHVAVANASPTPKPGVDNPMPAYPELARQRGQQGKSVVTVLVDDTGHVQQASIHASSGYALLDAAALKTLRTWKFTPAQFQGKNIAASIHIPIEFRLR